MALAAILVRVYGLDYHPPQGAHSDKHHPLSVSINLSWRRAARYTSEAAKLMLDWLGGAEKAAALENAIAAVIADGSVRTYDMGGSNTTTEVAEAVAGRLG